MEQLLNYARAHDVKNIYSVELADNSYMRKLSKVLGMKEKTDPQDIHQVIYSLSLLKSHG